VYSFYAVLLLYKHCVGFIHPFKERRRTRDLCQGRANGVGDGNTSNKPVKITKVIPFL